MFFVYEQVVVLLIVTVVEVLFEFEALPLFTFPVVVLPLPLAWPEVAVWLD